jgi:signal peptidase II
LYQLLVFGGLLVVLDQASKALVQARYLRLSTAAIQIRYVINRNPAYANPVVRGVLMTLWPLALAAAITLHFSSGWLQSSWQMAGAGCAIGGAAGNLVDIVRRQAVVDFLDLGWWPVFNVADIGIVGGLILAFCL